MSLIRLMYSQLKFPFFKFLTLYPAISLLQSFPHHSHFHHTTISTYLSLTLIIVVPHDFPTILLFQTIASHPKHFTLPTNFPTTHSSYHSPIRDFSWRYFSSRGSQVFIHCLYSVFILSLFLLH